MRKQLHNAVFTHHFSDMRSFPYALRGIQEHKSDFMIPLERVFGVF
jgi:hypothetical protein